MKIKKKVFFSVILLIQVQKRLKNEPGICCVAITDDASRIAFGIAKGNKYVVAGRLIEPSRPSL